MKTTRGTWLIILCLTACGGDEEPTGMDWGAAFEGCGEEAFSDGSYSVKRWQSGATPTEDVSARSKRWRGDAGRSTPAYPSAGPGFPGRGAQLSPVGRQIAQRFASRAGKPLGGIFRTRFWCLSSRIRSKK